MPSRAHQKLLAEQLNFGIRQAIKSSVGGFIATPVIALALADRLDSYLPFGWMALMFAVLTARNHCLRRALHLALAQAKRRFMQTSLGLAAVMALLPAWTLPELPLSHGLFFTTVLCVWLAAGMASLGVLPRLYLAYAGLVALGLGVGWLRSQESLAIPLVGLTCIYLLVLASFSRNFSKLVAAGIRIRLANAQLVKELQLANETKSRFILTASHDLRQPLHALGLFSTALSQSQTPEQMRAAAQGVQQSVASLEQLFSAVLDLSKMDAQAVQPELQPIFLPPLIGRLSQEYEALCREKGIRWECRPLPVTVLTDAALLERLLRNLLDNAVKHGGQGPVSLDMSLDTQLTLTVTDHGPGIPEAERAHIFEEFYRLPHSQQATGLGLGLSIVRRIVHLLGYRISIDYAEPQHQRGTMFRLEIPLA